MAVTEDALRRLRRKVGPKPSEETLSGASAGKCGGPSEVGQNPTVRLYQFGIPGDYLQSLAKLPPLLPLFFVGCRRGARSE